MRRLLAFVLGGVLLAGIVHIVVIFLVPYYARNDAWAVVRALPANDKFQLLASSNEANAALAGLDPEMIEAVCRFSLADRPLRVRAALPDDFWSIAVFDRRGRNVYSLNDRAAEGSDLDLIVLTPVQLAKLKTDPPASLDTAIVVELDLSEGFVLLRAFVSGPAYAPGIVAALKEADCSADL
jgi:uncharacterized membrane protein